MTNRIALSMGLMIIGAALVDFLLFDADHLRFLGKKMFDMMEWMAFWR